MSSVLVADGVRKTYGDTVALDDVSLTVASGEVLALVGPNGAGKTTLLRSLTGTISPDEGTIEVLGEAPTDVARDRLGVLPQAFSPPDRLTARELLHYYAGLYDDARDPDALLDSIGVASSGSTRYEHLSGGQQRRVCLGAALVNDPRVLLLDEPTTGIDPAGRRTVREQIASLADGGATILVTTHDMDEAERIADRVAFLANGRIRATGTPSSLIDQYGGPPRVIVDVEGTPSDEELTGIGSPADAIREQGFECTTTNDGRIEVTDVRPEAIESIVAALSSADVSYEGLEWRRPELEDAYLEIAGEDVSAEAFGSREHDSTTGLTADSAGEPAHADDEPGGDGS